tara:strand:- start:2221 stop:2640 length:420 start_codon:yes stop_codon:yes gene_type:complete
MNRRGFTLIEVMVTGAVIGVLATLAIPSYHQRIVRAQVTESLQLTEAIKADVEAYYRQNRRFPANNATIGLPPPDKLIGNYVNKMVEGNTISLRPLVVEDSPRSPMSWSCGTRAAPTGMVSAGENRTDVPRGFLPFECF